MSAVRKQQTEKRERVAGAKVSFMESPVSPMQVANLNFEMAVIGSVIQEPDIYPTLAEILQPADFFSLSHGFIWHAFDQLSGRNEPIDITTVMIELDKQPALTDANEHTATRLAECVEAASNAANAETYAKAVAEAALRMRVINAAGDIVRAALDKGTELDAFIDTCDVKLLKATNRKTERKTDMRTVVNAYFDRMEEVRANGAAAGVTTGFTALDKAFPSGFTAGELTILAGGEGMGKTTLALTMMRHILKRGQTVALFSLEMQQDEIMHNLTAMETGIYKSRLKIFDFANNEQQRLFIKAMGDFASWPLHIVDEYPTLTPTQLRRKLRKLIQQSPVHQVIIDGLWLMEASEPSETRWRDVSNITRDLVQISRDFNVPILLTHQYNADIYKATAPSLVNLSESAGVRRNSQVILAMHRSSYYETKDNADDTTWVYCLKDRNGRATGKKFPFVFDDAHSCYVEGKNG